MVYAMPNATNMTGFLEWGNSVTGNLFIPIIIFLFAIVIVLGLSRFGISKALAVCGITTTIITSLFAGINLIDYTAIIVPAVFAIAMTMVLYFKSD